MSHKVRVVLSVDIPDLESWNGGDCETVAELREDVKQYVLSTMQGSAKMDESNGIVSVMNWGKIR